MKFKSAEADWNTLFVPQHAEGRNSMYSVARKLYRLGAAGWVYWTGDGVETWFRRGLYEDLFEVCCEFLDERVSGDGVDGLGTDHVDRKGKEEECEFYNEHRDRCDYARWSDDSADDYLCDADDGRRARSAEHNKHDSADHDSAEDDDWPGQRNDPGAAAVGWISGGLDQADWIRRWGGRFRVRPGRRRRGQTRCGEFRQGSRS